ncbi:MAG: prolyl oligopeptidase family serine peptidase [Planctomycetota bacterium]
MRQVRTSPFPGIHRLAPPLLTSLLLAPFVLTPLVIAPFVFGGARPPLGVQYPAAQPTRAAEIVVREALVIERVGTYRRSPVHVDAIEALLVEDAWRAPSEGDSVTLPDGATRRWQRITAGDDGWFAHSSLSGGYAYASVPAEQARIAVLEASGHGIVEVNGSPRGGDPYQTGWLMHPVRLDAGMNGLLFHVSRGRLRVTLTEPSAPAFLNTREITLPDLIVGESERLWGGVVVVNASETPRADLVLSAISPRGDATLSPLPPIPPLSSRKVAFAFEPSVPGDAKAGNLTLRLLEEDSDSASLLDEAVVRLDIRRPGEIHRRTLRSGVDGSVQYYAVNPAFPLPGSEGRPALVLTLHGASVDAVGQARSYASKSWCHIVAPTNRRPYGFDWEDWGRIDALEVLEHALNKLPSDPGRVYLTGHSMGGHGVWQLGAHFPDRFAALGPSAGWISFFSYAGGRPFDNLSPIEAILARAASPSNTLALCQNYAQQAIYVLHGAEDDNVPVREARTMQEKLQPFHRDFIYHEQVGAGHWWDASDEPGVDCVDWAPLFDCFARHALPPPGTARQVDFVTVNPAVSAQCHWVTIESQQKPLEPSSVSARVDPGRRRFVVTTSNVSRLALRLDLLAPSAPVEVEIDTQKLSPLDWPGREPILWLARNAASSGDPWQLIARPSSALKGPHRYGPFKEAFRNHLLFVYGTRGTDAENRWAYDKARYDAETFWYRGNAAVEVIPDTAFDPQATRDRNVIVYGHSQSNGAWAHLLGESPVQVARGTVAIGDQVLEGEDLACLFVRPKPESPIALVGVVSGSGVKGLKLTLRLPYFVSGVAYPDCIVLSPTMLTQEGQGIVTAGFFGEDWGVETGDFAWIE